MSINNLFLCFVFFSLCSSLIYILTNDMIRVNIGTPHYFYSIKRKEKQSLKNNSRNQNRTISERLQCNASKSILKGKLIIEEKFEEWSLIEKRNQVSNRFIWYKLILFLNFKRLWISYYIIVNYRKYYKVDCLCRRNASRTKK